jgi:hypothetical protein
MTEDHNEDTVRPASAERGPEGIEAVRRWLRETGYPLEYAAARTLQQVGFRALQGLHYTTPADTTKAREVDVVAEAPARQIAKQVFWDDFVLVRLVVECEVLRTPWVVLTRSGSGTAAGLLSHAIGSSKAIAALVDAAKRAAETPDLFATPARHGFSVIESRPASAAERRNGERKREEERIDGGYAALAQVVSAVHGLRASDGSGWSLYWPVVVVRGPLFHLGYDDEGTEILESVEWQRVFWAGHPSGPTHVDVVRERHLEAYSRRALAGLSECAERLRTASAAGARKKP